MFSWYSDLTTGQRNTFWACYGGWALDAMDVQFYTFLIPSLTVLWNMSAAQAGAIASTTLFASAIGGWVTGILADRYGRLPMLQASILCYSACTAASGLTNSFNELLIVRGLQGFGFGGEWTAGAVLMGEIVRAEHRGKVVGTLQSGWAIGWGLAALISTFALTQLPADWGWRTVFFVGAAPALMLLFVRRRVQESPLFLEQTHQQLKGGLLGGIARIFSPELLRTTVLCSLLSTGALGGYYALMIWLPTYLRLERGLTVLSSGLYLGLIIFGAFAGYLVGAYLSDVLGRRRNFLLYAVAGLVIVAIYTNLPIDNDVMLILGFPLGFCAVGVFSGIGPFFTELFPTSVRASGQGFSYNLGRAIGASFPVLVGLLSAPMTLGRAIGVFSVIAYGIMLVAAYCLPETRGAQLESGLDMPGAARCGSALQR